MMPTGRARGLALPLALALLAPMLAGCVLQQRASVAPGPGGAPECVEGPLASWREPGLFHALQDQPRAVLVPLGRGIPVDAPAVALRYGAFALDEVAVWGADHARGLSLAAQEDGIRVQLTAPTELDEQGRRALFDRLMGRISDATEPEQAAWFSALRRAGGGSADGRPFVVLETVLPWAARVDATRMWTDMTTREPIDELGSPGLGGWGLMWQPDEDELFRAWMQFRFPQRTLDLSPTGLRLTIHVDLEDGVSLVADPRQVPVPAPVAGQDRDAARETALKDAARAAFAAQGLPAPSFEEWSVMGGAFGCAG